MVRYNPTSILRNIDLDSVRELRAIMVCIETLVRPPLGPPFVMLTPKDAVTFRLAPTSLAPVNRILQSMEHNYHEFPLLGNAIGRFVAAKDRSNEDVRLAGLELEELAMESTLRFPLVHGGEYEVACDRFARLLCMDKENPKAAALVKNKLPDLSPKKKVRVRRGAKDVDHTHTKVEELIEDDGRKLQKRKRQRQCLSCRNAHTKCDKVLPTCSACKRQKRDCFD